MPVSWVISWRTAYFDLLPLRRQLIVVGVVPRRKQLAPFAQTTTVAGFTQQLAGDPIRQLAFADPFRPLQDQGMAQPALLALLKPLLCDGGEPG